MVSSNKKQLYLVLLLLILLFFLVTVFRQYLFWNSYFGVAMYILLVGISFVGFAYYFSKLTGIKPFFLIFAFIVCEILLAFSFYLAPQFLVKTENRVGGKKREILLSIAKLYDFYASNTYGSRFNVFQYDNGRYDSSFFYRLNTGIFRFENVEFEITFHLNSQGFRDDETSLVKPKIILLGDSFSFGIGVEEEQTYAQIIEKSTGQKLLNTGIPSYGTAREYLRLKTLDTDSTKILLLQYCNNDLLENIAFNKNSENFLGTEKSFKSAFFNNITKKYYFPFKYLNSNIERLCNAGLQKFMPNKQGKEKEYNHGEVFVPILKKIQEKFKGNIILFSLDNTPDSTIYNGIKQAVINLKLTNVYPVNVLKNLKASPIDFYHFDGHINKKGHQKVAAEILKCIKDNKLL